MRKWDAGKLQRVLSERMRADIASCEIGGAMALVSQDGRELCRVVEGLADVEAGVKLRDDHIFLLASMTKVVTAAAVMREWQRGALSLGDAVADYLPAYRHMTVGKLDEAGRAVPDHPAQTTLTIRHLLTHTCGVNSGPVGNAQWEAAPPEVFETETTLVDHFATTLLDFEPGSAMAYSGIGGLDIAARIVEITSGMAIEEYLAEHIFVPLGMRDTTYTPTDAQLARLVRMHDCVEGKSVSLPVVEHRVLGMPPSLHSGSASLMGTADDYLHFAEMWANAGRYAGQQVLDVSTVAVSASGWLPHDLPGLWPGMNWSAGMYVRHAGVLTPGSFGWSGAFGTHFWADPANRLAAVYMRNSAQANGAGAATAARFEADVMSCALD
ncbi:MAG: beta-lactamase family protein [Chloroflexi bacterium]|nr:beta-lactamase family protein [Chloroflexota bacterium]